jgi:hypothetical protein
MDNKRGVLGDNDRSFHCSQETIKVMNPLHIQAVHPEATSLIKGFSERDFLADDDLPFC